MSTTPLSEWYRSIPGAIQRARTLATARVLGDETFRKFFDSHAKRDGANDYFDNFTFFMRTFEEFVLDSETGNASNLGKRYRENQSADTLTLLFLWIADAYAQAALAWPQLARTSNFDKMLTSLCDRMRQFTQLFGSACLPNACFQWKVANKIHDEAMQSLQDYFTVDSGLTGTMKQLRLSMWYMRGNDTRHPQPKVNQFARSMMPKRAHQHLN